MIRFLPIILMILGGAIGAGAGIVLKSPEDAACPDATEGDECEPKATTAESDETDESGDVSYVAMKNQFVVPVIRNELVRSLVVLSLSLESTPENSETIFSREPKLRDVFLQVLFDHAHIGGFDGAFTESSRLSVLKAALLEAAQSVLGPAVTDVIITDIVRQEV